MAEACAAGPDSRDEPAVRHPVTARRSEYSRESSRCVAADGRVLNWRRSVHDWRVQGSDDCWGGLPPSDLMSEPGRQVRRREGIPPDNPGSPAKIPAALLPGLQPAPPLKGTN